MSDDKEVFSGLDELFDYKNQFIDDIMKNQRIIRMLSTSGDALRKPEELLYKQIFPYEYVPYTVEHGSTFICCEVDIRRVSNKTYLSPEMYVWVFTHDSLTRLPQGGLRVDSICSEITRVINGSRLYGLGQLNLYSATRFAPITHYQGRTLVFEASDFNRIYNPKQKIPVNRKRV